MAKYLTPVQYRNMNYGMISADITDFMLAQFIQNAETDIDAWMGFDLKVGGFEQHTTWSQTAWDDNTLRTRFPTFPVPIIMPTRYRIQVSNMSNTGAGFFAIIQDADISINVFDGYVEIVPLQSVVYSLSPVILQLGLQPPIVQLDALVGFYLPALGETLYNAGDNQTFWAMRGFRATQYQTSLSIQPNVPPPVPPIVYANGVIQSNSTYTVNATDGSVVFTTAFTPPVPAITADYTYTIPDAVKQACIAQVNHLLGQRLLNLLGMQGVQTGMSGEQRLIRTQHDLFEDRLSAEAANKLIPYVQIAVM